MSIPLHMNFLDSLVPSWSENENAYVFVIYMLSYCIFFEQEIVFR